MSFSKKCVLLRHGELFVEVKLKHQNISYLMCGLLLLNNEILRLCLMLWCCTRRRSHWAMWWLLLRLLRLLWHDCDTICRQVQHVSISIDSTATVWRWLSLDLDLSFDVRHWGQGRWTVMFTHSSNCCNRTKKLNVKIGIKFLKKINSECILTFQLIPHNSFYEITKDKNKNLISFSTFSCITIMSSSFWLSST